MNPLVSIIMPVYNAAQYVHEAIDSVMAQSWKHWELLVINDGSTDNSHDIILGFKDPRINYFPRQKNQGVSTARNVGLKHMKGDFFCFLDADDVLPAGSIKNRLNLLISDPKIDFADGRVLKMDEKLEKVNSVYQPTFSGNPLKELLLIKESCFFGPSWLIRRKEGKSYHFDTGMSGWP